METINFNAPIYETADVYENYIGRWSQLLAKQFISLIPIKPELNVLDMGAGTGNLSQQILNNIKVKSITCLDPSDTLLAAAKQKLNSPMVNYILGYGEKLPFEDRQFDASLALLSLHNIPKPELGLQELIRVTKNGGMVAACEWDFYAGMEMFRILWDCLCEIKPEAAKVDTKNTPLGKSGQLTELWRTYNLNGIVSNTINIPLQFKNFDDYFQPTLDTKNAAVNMVEQLNQQEYDRFINQLKSQLLKNNPDGPFVINAKAFSIFGFR